MLGVLHQNANLKDTYPTVKDGHAAAGKRRTPDCKPLTKDLTSRRGQTLVPLPTGNLVDELLENSRPPASQAGSARLPTDFSGLIPKGSAANSQQPESKRPRNARTFGDIVSQRPGRSSFKEPSVFSLHGDYLPPPLAAPTLGTGASAGTQTAVERHLPPSEAAPIDWSLKTTARFSSPRPFSICEEAQLASAREVVEVQRCIAGCSGTAGLSLRQQYLGALLSFQHPQAARAASASSRTKGPDTETLDRRRDWQAAFCSLYDNFRNGQCAAFYYAAPEGSSRECVAFFGAAGVGGRQRVHAILTRSTAGTRALLQQGLGLGFAAPLMSRGLGADTAAAAAAAAAMADDGAGGSQSVLVFEGSLRVHGLFDFLLNESWRLHGDDSDVPLLLSPTGFLHGSLQALQPKVLGADSRDLAKAQHRLELRGLLPPWVLDRLTTIFSVTQDGCFTLMCDTHPSTLSLNWQPSSEAAPAGGGSRRDGKCLDDYAARERGCWDAQEAARWQAGVAGLSCNVVRELRCDGGIFTAQLSSKSAARLA